MPVKTVLLAEPDRSHYEILSGALEYHGYLVVAVETDELLDVMDEAWRPDLLVVAFPAQFSDGRSVFDWTRRSDAIGDVPILCVSEHAEPWELEKARRGGCSTVCVKPLDASYFAVQVRQLVGPSIRR